MKRTLTLALLLALFAVSASAQPGLKLMLNGELAFPTNPEGFTDGWSAVGYGGGLALGVELLPILTVMVSGNYTRVGLDEEGILPTGESADSLEVDGGAVNIFYLWAGGRLYLIDGPIKPYVVGGAGYYRLSVSDLDILEGVNSVTLEFEGENVLGANAGFGIEFWALGVAKGFVEGQYQVGFTDGESTGHLPVRVGLIFSLGP